MTFPRTRTLLRVFAFALLMTAAPVAFGTASDPGLQVNNACARGGKCCFEINSFCSGGTLDYFYSFGRCPWI